MYFDVMGCAPEVTVEVVNFATPPLRDAVFRLACHRRRSLWRWLYYRTAALRSR
jgi:hypothetical protein